MKPLQRYLELLNRIDKQTKRLVALHRKALVCRPGCTSCCTNLSVYPVEFHAIRQAMTRAGMDPEKLTFDTSASCGFLNEGLCRIYPFRPIICRTHGLPILFLDDSSGEYSWEVSFCELNFSGRGNIEFTDEMLLDIEEINTDLSRINHDFITLKKQEKEHLPLRVPLRALSTPSKE